MSLEAIIAGGGIAGLAENSPHSGITFGVTKEFRAFRVGGKKN